MAVSGAVSGRGRFQLFYGDAGALLEGPETGPPEPGREAGGGPGLVPPAGPAGHDALRGRLRGEPEGRKGKAGVSSGVRRELSPSHAPAGYPQGPQ